MKGRDKEQLAALRGPVDVKAEAARRLATARQQGNESRYMDAVLPGSPPMPVKLALLSCTDIAEARAQAYAYLKNDLELDPAEPIHLDLYQDEILTHMLFRATRDPEKPTERLASSPADFRDSTTPDERAALFDLYSDFRDSLDPNPDTLDPAVLKAMEELVKKKDRAGLLAFGGRKLVAFMLSTAAPPTS